jgi:hypothetical protein
MNTQKQQEYPSNRQPSLRLYKARNHRKAKRLTEAYKVYAGITGKLPGNLKSAVALFTYPIEREEKSN